MGSIVVGSAKFGGKGRHRRAAQARRLAEMRVGMTTRADGGRMPAAKAKTCPGSQERGNPKNHGTPSGRVHHKHKYEPGAVCVICATKGCSVGVVWP